MATQRKLVARPSLSSVYEALREIASRLTPHHKLVPREATGIKGFIFFDEPQPVPFIYIYAWGRGTVIGGEELKLLGIETPATLHIEVSGKRIVLKMHERSSWDFFSERQTTATLLANLLHSKPFKTLREGRYAASDDLLEIATLAGLIGHLPGTKLRTEGPSSVEVCYSTHSGLTCISIDHREGREVGVRKITEQGVVSHSTVYRRSLLRDDLRFAAQVLTEVRPFVPVFRQALLRAIAVLQAMV